MRSLVLFALSIALSAFGSARVAAWEADVHFGLTKWLAIQAGFSAADAERIAKGALAIDASLTTHPLVSGTLSCYAGDEQASITLHDHHFPSEKYPGRPPEERTVMEGKVWQRQGGRSTLRPAPNVNESDPTDLWLLGNYLHVLQDSWSHKGVPDMPPGCEATLGWGHPLERGGWACHLADLTYRWWDSDVAELAKATYDILSNARKDLSPKPWDALRDKVAEFAKARSKWAKHRWFEREGIDDRSFLGSLSLPDCLLGDVSCSALSYDYLIDGWSEIVERDRSQRQEAAPRDIREFFDRFLTALTSVRPSTLGEYFDHVAAASEFARAAHINESCPELFATLFPFLFGTPFLDGRGAHMPIALCEAAMHLRQSRPPAQALPFTLNARCLRARLPRSLCNVPLRLWRVSGMSCIEALAAAGLALTEAQPRGPGLQAVVQQIGTDAPRYAYQIAPSRDERTYHAMARFVHLPRDMLLLRAERQEGGPKIVSAIWGPNE